MALRKTTFEQNFLSVGPHPFTTRCVRMPNPNFRREFTKPEVPKLRRNPSDRPRRIPFGVARHTRLSTLSTGVHLGVLRRLGDYMLLTHNHLLRRWESLSRIRCRADQESWSALHRSGCRF